MAPLGEALHVVYLGDREGAGASSKTSVYRGTVDSEWVIGAVPQGGYVLGLILESCIHYQQRMRNEHLDPIHISAHYLRSTAAFASNDAKDGNGSESEKVPATFEVTVRTVKVGKGFTNLAAELVQGDNVNVMAHLIFGNLSTTNSTTVPTVTLLPPSPNAHIIPLQTHPLDAPEYITNRPARFLKYTEMFEDDVIVSRNKNDNNTRSECLNERPGLEWGAWLKMPREEKDGLRSSMIPFLADSFKNLPQILPKEERKGLGASWFPTMQLSIEFKAPLPRRGDRRYSANTVGLYSIGRFMQDPSGRHDSYVEVWTAPGDASKPGSNWREEQRCLAISSQMALTIPLEANFKRSKL
ncbi:hypothetical protein SCHPADRAFT_902928 [Schizopora paradoxa]|uniref:Thioesterase domain-containing protein n=1 Tax=Schizopora paradoxa TaxID=27342 RepID=A0A0H2RT40_9AGAM|nr:hypothetical protein SCHPADRAFT_902928 [Schizopora paradoxa]